MVKQCLKAIIHRLEMMVVLLLAIVLALVGLLIAIYGNGGAPVDLSQPAYQGNLLFSNTLGQVINFILTPLCVSLCCADCLFMQMKNGLYQLSIVRVGRVSYWRAFLTASGLIGFAVAALPFLLSMLLALIAFPLDSGAGYLHYVGYPSTVLYNYRYAGHAWEALVNSPYLMEGAMVLVIGLLGALYAVAGCLLTPFFRRNRILSLLAFPTALLIISFCLQAFGIDRYVWFLYFIASPDITLNLKDLWISLGVFACVIAALGLLQRKVCADEIS